jgi:hypothetical protein
MLMKTHIYVFPKLISQDTHEGSVESSHVNNFPHKSYANYSEGI